jgi:signal transduction histidine kinase/ActR/RegA family two-component response regulator
MQDDCHRATGTGEAWARNLIEKHPDGVVVVRDNGVICYVNPAAEALLGRPACALVGALFGRPLVPGETTEVDLFVPRDRGTPGRVAELRAVEIAWEGVPAVLASLRDVTEQKRADRALRFLADASTELAGSLDSQTIVASVARLAEQHLADWCLIDLLVGDTIVRRLASCSGRIAGTTEAASREELAQKLSGDFTFDPAGQGILPRLLHNNTPEVHDRVDEVLVSALALAPGQRKAIRALGCRAVLIAPLAAHGRTVGTITFVSAGTLSAYGPAEQALAQDLAHRAALALDNARLYHEAQEAVRLRDEFLAMLAHELRNPLAPILHAAHLMGLRGLTDPQLERARATIARQGAHMSRLLDDLLDLSRVTHGKIDLRREKVELAAVIADAIQATRVLVEGRRHHLTLSIDEQPLRVEADPTRLAQVVANLLNNAAKYTEPGGRIELRAVREGDEAVLCVKDTGIGIPSTMLSSIFEPFTQVNPSLDREHGGLGIGLALVRRLVELHGGRVEAHSPGAGRGSEFVVRLPLGRSSAPTPGRKKQTSAPSLKRHVLLIEDNSDGRAMLGDLLRLWGHEVEEAADGLDGLERIRRRRPEVALVDIGLPGLDGYRLAREVRALPGGQDVLLLAVTGYGQPEDRRRALEAGFNIHLVKPLDLGRLARLLSGESAE